MPSTKTADQLARDLAVEAIGVIAEEMRNPLNEAKDRLKAAVELLERGYGKPTQAIIAIPATRRVQEQAALMTEEELMLIVKGEPLPSLAPPSTDAEFEEIDPLLL